MAGEWQDIAPVSDDGWKDVGSVSVQAAPPMADEFASNAGGAAFGRPRRGRQAVVQPVTPLEATMAGVTKSVVDPFVGAAQFVTNGNLGTSELAQRLGDEAKAYEEVSPVGYNTGRVAGMLIPGTAAAKSVGAIPSFAARNKYVQGTLLGGASGLLTPEETGKTGADLGINQLQNLGLGATVGAIAPAAMDLVKGGYKAVKSLAEPFYDAGKDSILGRALIKASGGESDRAIANLQAYKPSVEGSQATMAEVARVPSLAALERSAIANNPEATNMLAARNAQRGLARVDYLDKLAGKDGQKAALETARDLTAETNYKKAFEAKAEFKSVPKEILEEKDALLQTPAIQKAVSEASENIANLGLKVKNPTQSIQGLHQVKLALDDQISRLKKPDMTTAETNKMNGIIAAKNRLVGFLENEKISPEYKKAREIYAAMSKPINELEAVEKIAEKAVNADANNVYAQQLSRALKNAKKTGELSPQKLQQLEALKADVKGQQFAETAGKGGGSDTVQKLAYSNMMNEMGVPNAMKSFAPTNFVGNLASRFGDVLYKRQNEELASKLAQSVADPKEALRLMQSVAKNGTSPSKITNEQKNLIRLLLSQGAVQAKEEF